MVLANAVSKLDWDFCMDFEPYVKVHNLVSVHPKGIILGQMINLGHDLSCGGVSLSIG